MSVIAIDIGGTKVLGAVFSTDGKILAKKTLLLNGAGGEDACAIILDIIRDLVKLCPEGAVDAIGACVPGIVYHEDGSVWAPNIPGWERYPLLSVIKKEVGDGIHLDIESDRSCYILGEAWMGAAKGSSDAVYMAVGTGIGLGILLGGHIVRGHDDIAGAIGWTALQSPFMEEYSQCGCFETFASGSGIGKQLQKAVKEAPEYAGALKSKAPEALSSYDAFANYDSDPVARKVLYKAIEMWGMASANIVSLLNPEIVVFGGGVFGPAGRFIEDIRKEALKWGQPIAMQRVRFAVSTLPGEAALYGAARLVINENTKQ